jgi:membrane associated rhomboid family serine protease
VTVLGQRIPIAAFGLLVLVIGGSILGSIASQMGFPAATLLSLRPSAVLSGQLWRLLTWGFLDFQFADLFFGSLFLFQSSPDLARAWGSERFLAVCLGLVAASGVVTCIVALPPPFHSLMGASHLTIWPLALAVTIGWASLTPHGVVNFFFVLPIPTRQIAIFIVAATVVYGLMGGGGLVPALAAEGLMVLYTRGFSPRRLWLNLRFSVLERKLRRQMSSLREVKRDATDRPRWFH